MGKGMNYEKFWSPAFDTMDDFVFLIDEDFNIVKVNQSFLNFTKKDENFFAGRKCYEVMHQTDEPVIECPHKETLSDGKYAASEFYESGLKKWLFVRTTPIFDGSKRCVGSVHIATDMTGYKLAEEDLKNKIHALEVFQKSAIDRELKMVELKRKIEALEAKLKEK